MNNAEALDLVRAIWSAAVRLVETIGRLWWLEVLGLAFAAAGFLVSVAALRVARRILRAVEARDVDA